MEKGHRIGPAGTGDQDASAGTDEPVPIERRADGGERPSGVPASPHGRVILARRGISRRAP
jgi:hypothetical protein